MQRDCPPAERAECVAAMALLVPSPAATQKPHREFARFGDLIRAAIDERLHGTDIP
jgi:hypothetical protein